MKILLSLAFLAAAAGLGYQSLQDKKPQDPPAGPDMPKPGPEHTMLQKLAGTWNAVVLTKDPTGAEKKSNGTMTTRKNTDFHTVDDFQGEFMGMKFVGHGVNGYCPIRKVFFTFWTDSMIPTPLLLTGSYDATKKELTLKGECPDMTGKLAPCRTVARFQDDDHFAWAMFGPGPDGKEVQQLAIEYTRKK